MKNLCVDLIWHVTGTLDGRDICLCRQICSLWRDAVDGATQGEWRALYERRVGVFLRVGESFDWRKATVAATGHCESIRAMCIWDGRSVTIIPPWKCARLVYDETQHVLFDTCLRPGVARGSLIDANVVDFVYNEVIRLRGLQRSCLIRRCDEPCRNCITRRRCLVPTYDYYIRPAFDIDPIVLNECLAFLLTAVC
jgi:hypothetical protein